MPPKRGKKLQAGKASTATPSATTKSRKKQAGIQDENEESKSSKAGTKPKSRTSKISPTPEPKDSTPKKAQDKPKPTKRGTRIARGCAAGADSLPQNSKTTRKLQDTRASCPNKQGLNVVKIDQEATDRVKEVSQKAKKLKKGEKVTKINSKPKAGSKKGSERSGAQKTRALRGKPSLENDEDHREGEYPCDIDADAENLAYLNKSAVHKTEEKLEMDVHVNLHDISTKIMKDHCDRKEDMHDLSKLNEDDISNNSKVETEEMHVDPLTRASDELEEISVSEKKILSGQDVNSEILQGDKNNDDFSNDCKSDDRVISQETEDPSSLSRNIKQIQDTTHMERAQENETCLEQYENDEMQEDSKPGRKTTRGKASSQTRRSKRNQTPKMETNVVEETQVHDDDDDDDDDNGNISADSSVASITSKVIEYKDTTAESPEEFEGFEVMVRKKDLRNLVMARESVSYYEQMEDSDGNFEDSSLDSSEYVYEEEQNYFNKDTRETVDDPEEKFMGADLATAAPVTVAESSDMAAIGECLSESDVEDTTEVEKVSKQGRGKRVSQRNVRSKRLPAADDEDQERRNLSPRKRGPSYKDEILESTEEKKAAQPEKTSSNITGESTEEKCASPRETGDSINEVSIVLNKENFQEGSDKLMLGKSGYEISQISETEVTIKPDSRTSQQQRQSASDINESSEEKNRREESVDFVYNKSEEKPGRGRKATKKAVQLKEKRIMEKGELEEVLKVSPGISRSKNIVLKDKDTTGQESSSNLLEVSEENKLILGFCKSEGDVLMDSETSQKDNAKEDKEINKDNLKENKGINKDDMKEDKGINKDNMKEDKGINKDNMKEDKGINKDNMKEDKGIKRAERNIKQNKEKSVRKSRWDDPRKFEERCKEDVVQMSMAMQTQSLSQSSSEPVEIIQSKKDIITNTENVTTNKSELKQDEVHKVSPVEKDGDQKFDAVILLADSLLESSLRKLTDPGSHNIHMIIEKNLNSATIVNVVHKYKKYYSKHALWVLVSGIFNMAEAVTHPDCRACTPPVERLSTLDASYPSVEETAAELQRLIGMVYPVCKQVQDELGSNGLFILSPPVPVSVILEEAANSHQALHVGCKMHSTYCVDSKTIMSLHVSYNMFCDVWTKLACELMKRWLPVQIFQNFNMAQKGKHITSIRNPHRFQPYSLMAWVRMMTAVAQMAITKPFPRDIVPVKLKKDEIESALFNHVIVMGNLKYLDYLKELTADFPITFVDQSVDFDEDGIVIIKEEQKKWPQGSLCLILSGISGIAEPIECGPKCTRASCDDPLPIFIPKNQPGGDPEFTGMSNEDMVSIVVKNAFDFARDAVDYMKEGSALFLAPIMPVQAVWGDKNSKFSHDTLHYLVEEKSVPIFGAGFNEWINCAREFERKWIELTMEYLEEGSPVFRLYERYLANKPDIIQFVHDVNENLEDNELRKTWSKLVFNIMKDFLKKKDSEVLSYQAIVRASEYEDILQEAKSRYAPKSNQNQTSGDTGNWKDWSYEGQQYSYDSYQSDPSYYGTYGPNSWMMGSQAWPSAGPPPGYAPGPPPPGVPPPGPPPWGAAPPPSWGSWQSGAQPMWGSGPPPPPPSAPSAQSAPPPSWPSAPPPVWTSVPPPAIEAPPQVVKQQQSDPGSVSPAAATSTHHGGDSSVKPGANLMIQNVITDLKVDQAVRLLQCFGELTYLKWPLDHLNKPAKFLMACYKERDDAERCVRVLNYVKPFGKESEAKLVGATSNTEAVGYIRDDDVKSVTLIQDILKQIKDEKLLHLKDNSNRVVVSNISNLLTGKMINDIFFGLKANRSFKNLDLAVISTEEEHHFFVCGNVLTLKMMDGYRFPDKKLKVKFVGPDETKKFTPADEEAARAEIDSVMKKYVDTLAEIVANKYINKKDVNIYTFKTVRCQNDKTCKSPGLCHDYHIWKDRRRCPILFKYSDEMCTRLDSNGQCPARDKCFKAHSPLEIPFHLKNFRAHLCQSFRKKGRCDKTDKICAYLHPGTTEAFFDQQWRDLLVEGLEKTITYFVGAIMNLFKVSKLNCVRVLLITPAPEMVPLLVKSMEALVFSCDQEIQALPEDGKAKKATILVGTPKAVVKWMAEEKKRESVNIDRLKALIIDDGTAVVDYIDAKGYNFLIEFAKIKDLNKVITTEKITLQSTKALERLRILTDYKKIYSKGDDRSKLSPSRERSSSPSRKRRNSPLSPSRKRSEKYGSGNTDKYDDDRQSKEREKPKYHSLAEDDMGYEQNLETSNQFRQQREMQQEELLREQEMLLREQASLQKQIQSKQELEHQKQLVLEQERRREEERWHKQERFEKERKEKEAKERNYEAYMTAREKLKREHEKERKLYFDLPEAHPEYQEKYRVFLDQYVSHYPGRNDPEHCHKLWMLFWKELVSSMLETAYKKKREVLESEFLRSQSDSSSESSAMKRKAVGDEDQSSKYARTDMFDHSRPGTSSDSLIPTTSGHGHSTTSQPSQVTGETSSCSVPEAVTIISEVCHFLEELSPALRLVIHKIREVDMDVMETKKIFTNYDNVMIVRIASEKLTELSESFPSPNKEKLLLASYHASQLLQLSSEIPPVQKKPHHGLDIKKVAWATLGKDLAFIIQFITNALMYEGVTNPTQDEISDIFITITNAHYSMKNQK